MVIFEVYNILHKKLLMAIFLQVWKFILSSGIHGTHISKPVGSSSCPILAFFSDDVKQVSIAALLSKKADRFAQSVSLHGVIYKTLFAKSASRFFFVQ